MYSSVRVYHTELVQTQTTDRDEASRYHNSYKPFEDEN